MKFTNLIVAVLTLVLPRVTGDNILFLTPMGSQSHKIFFMGIVEVLAERGHQITMVSAYKPLKEVKNVKDVVLKDFDIDVLLSNVFESPEDAVKGLFFRTPKICSDTLGQKEVQDLKKEHFDLVIISMFFDYCYLSLVHHFKVPFIYASPAGLFGPFSDMMNNIEFPSISPNKLTKPSFPQSFKDRLINVVMNSFFGLAATYYLEPSMMGICVERGLCPPDMPSIAEISNNASIALINSIRTLEWPPRPAMPNIIYAGGAHIKPSKPLSKELEKWIEGAGDEGFIFFSLGSALKPTLLPENYRKILIKVFGSLKQRVLWKWNEETMPDLPANVKLSKWLPQQDILGHPKLRLFITHGGLLSTQESMFNGVRVIGMPVFADQYSNMMEVQEEGWGKVMQWKELEEKAFLNLIVETINDEKMKEISKTKSTLMRDQPIHPGQYGAYWVEYVLRHKGAQHIMSPVRFMKWYEVYNMDVYALLIVVDLVILYILWRLLKFVYRLCFGSQKTLKPKRKAE